MSKNHDPDYISETNQIVSAQQLDEWFRQKAKEAEKTGCTFCRMSVDKQHNPTKAIIEAWKKQPKDQGHIRWKK